MKQKSITDILERVSTSDVPTWSFLTNHARVLLCIAQDPGVRLRDIGDRVGITERAAHRIVDELVDAGYISRTRIGRRNHYAIHRTRPLPDSLVREQSVGDLLALLAAHERE
jgi:DNA-binding MarR family transcriptional regulator